MEDKKFINSDNPYYIGYTMLSLSLENENIYNNITKALDIATLYLDSKEISIYKKGMDNEYHLFQNSHFGSSSNEIVKNEINNNIESTNHIKEIDIKRGNVDNLTIIPLTMSKSYVIAITNKGKKTDEETNRFLSILKKTFEIIINTMESYREIERKTEYDALTGLKNRQAYNKDIDKITKDEDITFTIVDLFRLKYINDNVNHYTGDCYIKETAEILKEFFPSTVFLNGVEKKTGDEVYRIGGDEFIIISKKRTEEQVESIMKYVLQNAKEMDLEIGSDIVKGVNYGIVSRKNKESIEELYKEADKKLSFDKQQTYKKYGLNRRR